MTTPVQPFTKLRQPRSDLVMEWLKSDCFMTFFYIKLHGSFEEAKKLWYEHCDAVVAEHIELNPGTRPPLWWRFSSPEPVRQRLGGTGNPHWHPGNLTSAGLPMDWRDTLVDHDPVVYESEAAFLQRHGMLLPGELRRIPRRDFEPVRLRVRGDKIAVCRA